MLLFVLGFLVYRKTELNSRASGNTWFTTWLQTGHVKVVRKTNCDVKDNNFLGFITINNIYTPFFNWKIDKFISLVLLIIINVLLFNKIEWKILLPMFLALKFFYTSNYSLVPPRRTHFIVPKVLLFLIGQIWKKSKMVFLSNSRANIDKFCELKKKFWHRHSYLSKRS